MSTKDLDGFQSQKQGQLIDVKQTCRQQQKCQAIEYFNNLSLKDIDPPQQIKTKIYSLQPDITTGWAPKFSLPKPIQLSYPDTMTKIIIDKYIKQKPQNAQLCYLGPRYDNTYSAWKHLNLENPYKHLNQRKIILTDRIFVGNNPRIKETSLKFNSMFQSGNIDTVFKVDQYQYDCFMRVDANTRGHLQWYFFEVTNMKKGQQYIINICNFQKGKSLYTRGMRPYVFSQKGQHFHNKNWQQDGQNISYNKQKSKIQKILKVDNDLQFYQLSFTISTIYQDDKLSIAYCPPYTYSNLLLYLQNTVKKHIQRDIIYEERNDTSLSGLSMPMITITNNTRHQSQQINLLKPVKNKKLVFVMGRIHPGQANGSYMVQGLINWLCSNTPQSHQVRQRFVFKIVPMVNPDGVAIGNYRTGLSGRDLNRQFIDPDKSLFVQVNNIKDFLAKYKRIYGSSFTNFLDFHGHSIKKNLFTYGPEFRITTTKYYQCRILPKLISKKTCLFRYYSCTFNINKNKQSTARAVLIRQFLIPFSYTVQASNGFYVDQQSQNFQFSIQKWIQAGQIIGLSLFDYVFILKTIQIKRQQRRKQKQALSNSRKQRTKRYNSMMKENKLNIFTNKSIKEIHQYDNNQFNKQITLNQIIYEINKQKQKVLEKICSDDQLSQGDSDSQCSKDDINLQQLKNSIFLVEESNTNISKSKKNENHLKVIRIIKRNTLNSDLQIKINEEKRNFNYMRPKKSAIVRNKYEVGVSTHSPVKTQTNIATKIVNIHFQLNPVQKSHSSHLIPQDKMRKTKTQMGNTDINFQRNQRQELSQSFRKTFLSFHRDIIKKQSTKKIKRLHTIQKNPHKIDEVIGKRIFTELSL